ncbi:hypothetical protein ESY86_06500 [Subsaximicrobium wynnwilliamsii]|uniref:Uncharacterized protein n=1 Tax=Subsaximicrobium wynnwilliamsii TaxID=291179 RepID=A0A5C6ZMH1_9FLAO|nr:hypothetical protein [Subsaximicrobium wynnwilliamsii]TXD84226.1 hypothetical protein ESY87_06915 [Subsaximicrobium wynnwilliamsii]TXD89847.1 hypothetical protein ESY86_06500 [Subsaximicrobium wynnwilliamsii]TXE03938.1 hypothetical protein ESY88_06910 [Subsaximicrobium wynnwilliamsii]
MPRNTRDIFQFIPCGLAPMLLIYDIKNRPWLYEPVPSGNSDFNKIGALIASLFKRKQYSSEIIYVKPEDLQSLFASNSFFTKKMISKELNIIEDYQFLFFEFCSAQQIDMQLISEKKSLELLELLMAYSRDFKSFLLENPKDGVVIFNGQY